MSEWTCTHTHTLSHLACTYNRSLAGINSKTTIGLYFEVTNSHSTPIPAGSHPHVQFVTTYFILYCTEEVYKIFIGVCAGVVVTILSENLIHYFISLHCLRPFDLWRRSGVSMFI